MNGNRYRTLLQRFVASIIDLIVLFPLFVVMYVVNPSGVTLVILSNALAFVATGYFVVMHGRSGQTVGKMITKVRVVRNSDECQIGYAQSLKRETPAIVLMVVGGILDAVSLASSDSFSATSLSSILWVFTGIERVWVYGDPAVCLFNEKHRSLHDFIGGTVVVNEEG